MARDSSSKTGRLLRAGMRRDTLRIYVQMNLAIVLFNMLKVRCVLHALNIPVEVFQPPVQ